MLSARFESSRRRIRFEPFFSQLQSTFEWDDCGAVSVRIDNESGQSECDRGIKSCWSSRFSGSNEIDAGCNGATASEQGPRDGEEKREAANRSTGGASRVEFGDTSSAAGPFNIEPSAARASFSVGRRRVDRREENERAGRQLRLRSIAHEGYEFPREGARPGRDARVQNPPEKSANRSSDIQAAARSGARVASN